MNRSVILSVVVLALLLTGCGGSKGGGGGPVGKYVLDVDGTVQSMVDTRAKDGVGDAEIKQMREMMAAMFKEMKATIEVKSDNTFDASMGGGGEASKSTKGSWKVSGDSIEFTTTHEDGKKVENGDVIKGKIKNGKLEVQTPDGPTIVLKRA